jgi:hypothetical protein
VHSTLNYAAPPPAPAPATKGKGLGVAALVLGIIAAVLSIVPFINVLGIPLALVGLVLGIISAVQASGKRGPIGFGIAGLVCSAIALIITIAMYSVVAAESTSSPELVSPAPSAITATPDSGPALSAESDNQQEEPAATQPENRTEFNVGETIAFDGKEVIVTSVERDWSSDNQYMQPDEGKEFVKVNVTILNTSKNRASYNTFDWEIQDSGGAIEGISFYTYSESDSLGSGELVEGGTKSGSLIFEVPAGDPGLILHYNPSFWSSKEVTIRL